MIVKLPTTVRGNDSILVFVDRLSKMVHLIPTTERINAKVFAQLFHEHVVCKHGMPKVLISDRGTVVNNVFWQELCKILGIDHRMSTSYHPQTDGQTERTNRVLEEMMRSYIHPDQKDWDLLLPSCEFAINNSVHSTTGNTPFYLNTGQHPLTPITMEVPEKVPEASQYTLGIDQAIKEAKEKFLIAQNKMQNAADKKRQPVLFKPGDKVMLTTRSKNKKGNNEIERGMYLNKGSNVKLARKLKPVYMGPFEVEHMVGEVAE